MVEAGERVGSILKRWSFHGTAWLKTRTEPDLSTSNRLSRASWTISRAGSHASENSSSWFRNSSPVIWDAFANFSCVRQQDNYISGSFSYIVYVV